MLFRSPAYLTGLSIASSSAVIPVTLECCEKNGVSKDVRNFVVPLCANVHMAGSAIKLLTSAYAIMIIYNLSFSFSQIANFVFMLAIAAVAAPGVMGGVLMASVGALREVLWASTCRFLLSALSLVAALAEETLGINQTFPLHTVCIAVAAEINMMGMTWRDLCRVP